ncbi:MAG: universal stress protein [Deltaproteobacteria bacterium]|nr:MAG: universal stress protein [Deltaproteobacteria bacterium]
MSTRILLCADGSSYTASAAAVARQIAKAEPGSQLIALHIVNVRRPSGNVVKDIPGHLGFEPAVVSEEVLAEQRRQGEDLLAEISRDAELAGIDITCVCDQGAVAERIAHHARHVDLVVMGLRGSTEDAYPGQGGANLDSVLRRLLVPVLFVGKAHHSITGFILGYDGSDGAAKALKVTALVAQPLGLPVHSIYVSSTGKGGEILKECDTLYPDLDLQPHILRDDDPHAALVRAAGDLQANVLAVGFRGQSPLKNFLYGTTAEYILMRTDLMVLVAH